jgi:hypothetical protein
MDTQLNGGKHSVACVSPHTVAGPLTRISRQTFL